MTFATIASVAYPLSLSNDNICASEIESNGCGEKRLRFRFGVAICRKNGSCSDSDSESR